MIRRTARPRCSPTGFHKPGAVRFDAADQLYALDDETGELWALDRDGEHWRKRAIAKLATATDNMAMGTDGLIYVSNMADNGVLAVDPRTGAVRTVVSGALAFPRKIAMATGPEGDQIHVADMGAYRIVDAHTGTVRDVARGIATPLKFPSSVSVGPHHVVLTGEGLCVIQIYSLDGRLICDLGGFDRPCAAIECEDGSLIVAEPGAGRLLRVRGDERTTIVDGLDTPSALVDAGDGAVYVAESGSGRLLQVSLSEGGIHVVAEGFGAICDIAVGPAGTVAVLEARDGRLSLVEVATGATTQVARGLPVGYLDAPYARSGGVAVGADNSLYVAADMENAIYRITKS